MNDEKQFLSETADYFERYGWGQNSFGEDGGPRCLAGGFLSVYDSLDEKSRVTLGMEIALFVPLAAANRLRESIGVPAHQADYGIGDLVKWNDTIGRTKDEVVATLRAAAS